MESVASQLSALNNPQIESWLQTKREELIKILTQKPPIDYGDKKRLEQRAIELIRKFDLPVDNFLLEAAITADYEDFILEVARRDLLIIDPNRNKPSHLPIDIRPSVQMLSHHPFASSKVDIITDPYNGLNKYLPEFNYHPVKLEQPISNKVLRWSFHPNFSPLPEKETGLEQKIGGQVPFFLEGGKWPSDSLGEPMAFFAQFTDPRESGILTQIWIGDLSSKAINVYPEVLVKKYPAQALKSKNQILIPPPKRIPNKEAIPEPLKIESWLLLNEVNLESIKKMNINLALAKFDFIRQKLEYDGFLFNQFKIGGYGNTVRGKTYMDLYQNIYAGHWGDSGTLHLKEDFQTLEGDMA